ncbi:hypothetical protein LL240_05590 [Oceanimonas baumannii]|uniref:hypothetical protein n=1 Tax=Oceanimonas baumannii TaxID=129578 RepID=UPI001D197D0F|nr:hypothetical protein [Oceanimonas baumannii]MCC4263927.1 hypothetical protein [Oceanimonas baumannii]
MFTRKTWATLLVAGTIASPLALAGNGNGLPPGERFVLNVIAFDQCPAGDFTDSNRHMIAVQADFGDIDFDTEMTSNQHHKLKNEIVRNNTIELGSSGLDGGFQVVDGNACGESKGSAMLMMPITDANCDDGNGDCTVEAPTFTQYQVYVRTVGKPGTGIGVTSCATEPDETDVDGDGITDQVLCSTENVVMARDTGRGKMRFEDVSAELLTVCLDTMDDEILDGECDVRYALFDPALVDYFWQWNTSGKAHAQLVFIPVP